MDNTSLGMLRVLKCQLKCRAFSFSGRNAVITDCTHAMAVYTFDLDLESRPIQDAMTTILELIHVQRPTMLKAVNTHPHNTPHVHVAFHEPA